MLDNIGLSSNEFAKAIIRMFNISQFELVIDRTNWSYGKCDFNLFLLSVIWNNITIPIYWISLDKKAATLILLNAFLLLIGL